MPLARRGELTQRRGWTDGDRLYLNTGCDFFGDCSFVTIRTSLHPVKNQHRNPPSADLMRRAWEDIGREVLAERIQERPATRPWYWWVHLALPAHPRLALVEDAYGSPTDEPEGRRAWEDSTGHEPSLHYLVRRGLLEADELDRLRSMEADTAKHWLEYQRFRHRMSEEYRPHPWELAGVALVAGVDALTAAELSECLPYLNEMRQQLEGAAK